MELNEDYQAYSGDENDNSRSSLCPMLLSCLYTYTFGSCRYFGKTNISLSRKDRVELRTLWKSQLDTTFVLREDDEWKKKTKKADCLMKKRIRYHFKDHIRKWTNSERPRFPWKMMLHILLVVVVTVQVSLQCIRIELP